MIIKILGSGCKKCKKLEENARQAISQLTGDHSIEKVTDLDQFMNYGVMITPALVIDEEVVSVGKVLSPEDIKKLIENK
jgi:small redox-active disulfide protein 2